MKNIIWLCTIILFSCMSPSLLNSNKLVGEYATKDITVWLTLRNDGSHTISNNEHGLFEGIYSPRGHWSIENNELIIHNKMNRHPIEINVDITKKPKLMNGDKRKIYFSISDSLFYDESGSIWYETNVTTRWEGYFSGNKKEIELPDALNEICFFYGHKKCYNIEKDSMDYYIELSLDKSYVPFYYEKDTLEVKSRNKIIWNGIVLKRVK